MWLPIAILPFLVIAFGARLAPWVFMWLLSFALFFGLKWLVLMRAREKIADSNSRSFAFLFAWPGMDAETFLDVRQTPPPPSLATWACASTETIVGAVLLWGIARVIPPANLLARGWVGMLGLILLLHFGSFQVISLFWQSRGVKADPIMVAPLRSTSLSEFWGRRWNLGFRQLAHELVFRPIYRRLGPETAGLLVFAVSGIIHDLVISLPARAGYGLPTLYFLIQGGGVSIERSQFGKRIGLGRGVRGWCFMMLSLVVPLFGLFHPWFVMRVILPFMKAIHAL